MNFIFHFLFFGIAGFAVIALAKDNMMYPLLEAKGLAGTRNCGNKNDLITILSLTLDQCDKTPCEVPGNEVATLSIEFTPLENITSVATTVTAIMTEGRVPLITVNSCEKLTVSTCPFIKGETYVQVLHLDMLKLRTPLINKVMKELGHIDGGCEVLLTNPQKRPSACAFYAVNVV